MIKNEFRKLINKRLMILLAIILVANIVVAFVSNQKPPADKDEINTYIELYKNNRSEFDYKYGITEEPSSLNNNNKEYYCIVKTKELYDYVDQYTADIDSILFQAHVNASEGSLSTYAYAYQKQVIKSYEKLDYYELPPIYVLGWDSYLANNQQCIFILIAVIILASFIIINDYDVGMNLVIHTTANGKTKTIISKMLVSMFSATAVSLLISGTTIISIALSSGFSGGNAPIQLIPMFEFCPFKFSLIQYTLIQLLIRAFGFAVIGITTVLVSLLFKSYVLSAMCVLAMGLINNLVLNYQLEYKSITAAINWWLLVDVNTLFEKLYCCKLFNDSLLIIPTTLFSLLVLSIIVSFAIVHVQSKYPMKKSSAFLQKSRQIFKNNICPKIGYRNLFQFEQKKIFYSGTIVVLCVFCIIMKGYISYHVIPDQQDEIYQMYTENFKGNMTLEKKTQMAKIRKTIDTVLSSKEDTLNKYRNGEITDAEYRIFMQQYWDNYILDEEFAKIELYASDLAESNSVGWIIYDTGYNLLFGLGPDFILSVLLFIISYGVFFNETKLKTDQLNSTTINGKSHLYNNKILGLIIRAIIVSTLFSLIDMLTVKIKYDFTSLDAPIQSLRMFDGFQVNITIGQFLLLFVLLKILYSVGFSILISLIGLKSKNSITIIALTLMILFVPFQLGNYLPVLKYLDITNYLSVTPMIILSDKSIGLLCLIPCTYLTVMVLFLRWAKKRFTAAKE